MNIALLSLVVVLAQTAAALPGGLDGQKQNRIAELNLPEFDRTSVSFVECSKKTEKVVLGYGELAMFESPNFPENYPSKTTCNWLFKSEEDITIVCDVFELQNGKKGKCQDKLTIGSTEYCGKQDDIYYEGTTSEKVRFRSNKKNNYSGFNCYAFGASFLYATTIAA